MSPDIVVCGAGIAGSVLARRLAAQGARVALIGPHSAPGCEGLSARARALLGEEGVCASLFTPALARRGWWGEGRRIEGEESLADRRELAASVRRAACDAGVQWHLAPVTGARRVEGHWRVRLGGGAEISAPVLIDARGRRGAALCGPRLLAIGQSFRRPRGACGTGIGVADFGWCWWAAHGTQLYVQVIARKGALRPDAWIGAAAAQIAPLAQALERAQPASARSARTAQARLAEAPGEEARWWVGDAAMALDPLSGQGVFEAVRGARLIAAAVASAEHEERASAARQWVSRRLNSAFMSGVRTAARLYAENAAHGDFWSSTAAAYAEMPAAAS